MVTNPSYQVLWEAVEGGSGIGSFPGSSSYLYTYDVSSNLNSIVQEAINTSNKKIHIGFMSATEVSNVPNTTLFDLALKIYYYRQVNFTIRNNFNAGSVIVNNVTIASGSPVNTFETNTNTLQAIEPQSNAGTNYLWNDTEGAVYKSNWDRNKGGSTVDKGVTQSISSVAVYTDDGSEFVANMRPYYSVTFNNNLVGLSNWGVITVDGISYNSPTSAFQIVEQNVINVSANTYYYNEYIEYDFINWSDGNLNPSRTISPINNETFSAHYRGRPTNTEKYVSAGAPVGQPIVVTWADNLNPAVNRYDIWRRVKHNGVVGNDVFLATVGRGVQTYTDNEYVATNGYTNDLIWYDVRSYYSTEGTFSDPNFTAVYGQENISMREDKSLISILNAELPEIFSINNYPNPFNPTTTISYQLPENSIVTIKVYDILGKEMATLVNGIKNAGYHNVSFDARKLTSGIYIYTINAGKFTQSKKMLLMK